MYIEEKMHQRFDRLDAKFSGMRVELTKSQESIHYIDTACSKALKPTYYYFSFIPK